jgi:hypothetical protein
METHRKTEKERQLADGRGGGRGAESKRPQESRSSTSTYMRDGVELQGGRGGLPLNVCTE